MKEGENTMHSCIIVCTQLICNAPRLLCRLGERGISSVEQHGGIPFLLFTDFTTDLASLEDGLGASSSGVYCSLHVHPFFWCLLLKCDERQRVLSICILFLLINR